MFQTKERRPIYQLKGKGSEFIHPSPQASRSLQDRNNISLGSNYICSNSAHFYSLHKVKPRREEELERTIINDIRMPIFSLGFMVIIIHAQKIKRRQ